MTPLRVLSQCKGVPRQGAQDVRMCQSGPTVGVCQSLAHIFCLYIVLRIYFSYLISLRVCEYLWCLFESSGGELQVMLKTPCLKLHAYLICMHEKEGWFVHSPFSSQVSIHHRAIRNAFLVSNYSWSLLFARFFDMKIYLLSGMSTTCQ